VTTTTTRQTTVLLIEDSDSDAEHFNTLLRRAAPGEFDVARATTLADATSYLKTQRPDCAVVDLKLTDAESVEIVEALAVLRSPVALIVLTRHEDDELDVADIVAGPIDYLSKGAMDGELLVRSIRHAILRARFESSLAEAQSIARLGSWEMDLATYRVSWSRELYRLFGFRLDEKPTYDALVGRAHPDDRESCRRAHRATIEDFTSFKLEHRIVLRHGVVRWVRARGRVELDAAGRPERLLGTVQDITEQ
jgi:PAS domain S-box-containing protein